MEMQRLRPIAKWDHEVEVLPCERDAKGFFSPFGEGPGVKPENRIDQRMPPEFVTGSFLPSK
jgi:hypothetical protein